MNKKVLFIMDPIENIDISKDTTFQLMHSAQKAGHEIYYLIPNTLSIKSLEPMGKAVKIYIKLDELPFFNDAEVKEHKLSSFDYVLMRKDPPVNNDYIYITYILDILKEKNVRVLNSSYALRNYNEKLLTLFFKDDIPDTILTKNRDDIALFKKKYKKIILKPLNLMGGRSIYFLDKQDKNLNVIFEDMTNMGKNYILAQEYIEDVKEGDKRVIVINGKVFREAVIRTSNKKDHRANIAAGGSIEKYYLKDSEFEVCQKISNFLKKEDIFFAGIDMIGHKITEINITSPTCIAEINRFHGINLANIFWDELE